MFLNFIKRRKRAKEAEPSSSCVTGQYKKSDESTNDTYRSNVNERCDVKENIVNRTIHGVSVGGSLFNLTELFEKKSRIPNPWNTLRRSKHQLNSIKPKQETLGQNTRNKDDIRLQNHCKLDQYQSSPSLFSPNLTIRTDNKEDQKETTIFPAI